MLALFNLISFTSIGAYLVAGTIVAPVEDYYGLNNAMFNVLLFASAFDFVISTPLWNLALCQHGLRITLLVGVFTMLVGYSVQMAYVYSYWTLVVGGMLVDTGRVLTIICGQTFTARWFSPHERGLAFGILYLSEGMFSIGSFFAARGVIDTADLFKSRFIWFVAALLVLTTIAFFLLLPLFEEAPARPPGPPSDKDVCGRWWTPQWKDNQNYGPLMVIVVSYIIATVPSWSVPSVLVEIMTDHSYSDNSILIAVGTYLTLSTVASPIVGYIMDKTHAYRLVICVILIFTTILFLVFVITLDNTNPVPFIVSTALFGLATGCTSTMFTVTAVELAFPTPEAHVQTLMMWVAQFAGALGVAAISFSTEIVHIALWVFLSLYAVLALTVGISLAWPVRYTRLDRYEAASTTQLHEYASLPFTAT